VCNLHLRSMSRRHDEITAAGVREVVVFHSTAALRPHTYDLPFAVVADPDKGLYAEFAAESSARSLLDPRAWPAIVRAIAASTSAWLRGRQPLPTVRPAGGRSAGRRPGGSPQPVAASRCSRGLMPRARLNAVLSANGLL
jgi:AhpC/TSA antioxidant enzyme